MIAVRTSLIDFLSRLCRMIAKAVRVNAGNSMSNTECRCLTTESLLQLSQSLKQSIRTNREAAEKARGVAKAAAALEGGG